MEIDVRTITQEEVPAWCAALNTGFLNPAGAADAEVRRPVLILERTWGAFDDGEVVATLRSFGTELTVPGGATLPASAVTAVTTIATHRRRGLATHLVTAELTAAAARGERLSVLIAAQWGIYGRFGYGAATEHQSWTVDAASAVPRGPAPQGRVRFVDRDTARQYAPQVHERQRRQRPGEIGRPERFWDLDFGFVHMPSWPPFEPGMYVLAEDAAGVVIGVARYRHDAAWRHRQPRGEVTVDVLVTANPAAEILLWRHLLSLDLVYRIRINNRPVDDLLPWLLTDARHAAAGDRADFVWVRPLHVPAMLTARSYLCPGEVVIEVLDPLGPAAGRYHLRAGTGPAECAPTSDPADLTLDVATLGSIYLGGYPAAALARAGAITEHTSGALGRIDAMFRTPLAPWCSTWF